MATDQKLISSLLDLSRNVDKLSGDIKKNTTTTADLVSVQEKASDGTKDLGKIAESIKGLDLKSLKGEFSALTKSMNGLDFKSLSSDLKSLDFKGLSNDLKSLDFKGLTQGIKGLDFKGLTQSLKGFDLKGISDLAGGLDVKGIGGALKGGGAIKDVVSGSLGSLLKGGGKGILGAFADGGEVNQTGNYLVGERGPEVVKLDKGNSVISNDILKERQRILKKLGETAPGDSDISNKRRELISSDPDLYMDNPEYLEQDINSYLEGLDKNSTFTREDVQKLGKQTKTKTENLISPEIGAKSEKKNKEPEASVREKKEGLFSKVFGKINNIEKASGDKSILGSDIIERGKDLLKSVDKNNILSTGSKLLNSASGLLGEGGIGKMKLAGDLLSKPSSLKNQVSEATVESKIPELKTPEIKTSIKKLSPQPQPKPATKQPTGSEETKIDSIIKPEEDSKKESTQETKSTVTNEQSSSKDSGITSNDIKEMKAALVRIASLLEGPLNVSSMERPFRPDSRRV